MDEKEQRSASLIAFLEAARAQRASDAILADVLERRGWPRKEIYSAFGSLYERLSGMQIPTRAARSAESARDAFLYLLSFGTLGTWTCGLGSLLFTLIDLHFPDSLALRPYRNPSAEMSGAMASIIVAYPVYLMTMWLLIRGVRTQPDKLESGVRKWLTYLALLIAAATAIGDVVTFLSYFLRGELTARFSLKVLVVFIIASGVFWYYLLWLEKPAERRVE